MQPTDKLDIGTAGSNVFGAPQNYVWPFHHAEPKKATKKPPASKKKSGKKDEDEGKVKKETEKPRLTIPDVELECGRSQLRFSRSTPGRVRNPCYDEFDVPADLKEDLSEVSYAKA